MGLFDKFKQGLKKTAQILNTDVRDLFKREGRLVDDQFLEELLEVLLRTDMGVQSARYAVARIHSHFHGRIVQSRQIASAIRTQFLAQ